MFTPDNAKGRCGGIAPLHIGNVCVNIGEADAVTSRWVRQGVVTMNSGAVHSHVYTSEVRPVRIAGLVRGAPQDPVRGNGHLPPAVAKVTGRIGLSLAAGHPRLSSASFPPNTTAAGRQHSRNDFAARS